MLLQKDRQCSDGTFDFKFYMYQKGFAGVVFRYKNSKNFYLVEFSPLGTKVIQTVASRRQTIEETKEFKIEHKKWIHGRIEFKGMLII